MVKSDRKVNAGAREGYNNKSLMFIQKKKPPTFELTLPRCNKDVRKTHRATLWQDVTKKSPNSGLM